MTATTTASAACGVYIYLDNGAGTLTDIRGSASQAELTLNNNLGEVRTFGSRWMLRTACGQDASVSLTIVYSTTADEGYDIVRDWWTGADYDTPRSLRIDIPDNAGERWDMEVLLESATIPLDPSDGGPILVSCNLLPTGDIIHSSIGS
jgi:hypothetical protein